MAHPDRPEMDKQRDDKCKPAQVLEFLGIHPGMTVLEVMAGVGYYTELLSRVVGPQVRSPQESLLTNISTPMLDLTGQYHYHLPIVISEPEPHV